MLEMNLIKEARNAALFCNDYTKRVTLQRVTDELHDVFGRFTVSCSREDMTDLVAAWTRVILALNDLPVLVDPDGGRRPVAIHGKLTG